MTLLWPQLAADEVYFLPPNPSYGSSVYLPSWKMTCELCSSFSEALFFGAFASVLKLISDFDASSTTIATNAFIGIWFVVAPVNMWIGVSQAGYSFKEELPIFLLIFLLPAAVAAVLKWKFL
jgi:hypothetical protein